jgi:hypothetical protein
MRTDLAIVLALGTVFGQAPTSPQAQPAAAALLMVEQTVYVNDRAVDPTALPVTLSDSVVLRSADGKAAIALKRGGWLFIDAGASVRIHANSAYNFNRIEMLAGSAIVVPDTSSPVVECESAIRLSSSGHFRFDVRPLNRTGGRPCQIRVYEGAAAVPLVSVTNALRSGQSMTCDRQCGDMIPTMAFSPADVDQFDRWARQMQAQLRK